MFVHTSASCHRYSWVIANTSMSHIIYVNESCHVHQCVMSYVWESHTYPFLYTVHSYDIIMTWCVDVRKMTHLYLWHVSMRYGVCIRSHFTYINEACNIILPHAIYMNESRHVHTSVVSYIWMYISVASSSSSTSTIPSPASIAGTYTIAR